MRAVLVPLCIVAVQGLLAATSNFSASTPLANQAKKLRVVFWDFDKTITVGSFGDHYLTNCDPNCMNYTSYSCTCNATVNYFGDFYTSNYSGKVLGGSGQALNGSDMRGLNGTDRRDRLLVTLQHLAGNGVDIRMLSTSWVWIRNDSWAYFLNEVMKDAGINGWFNTSNIMTLDDPGSGISADKGSKAKAYMDSKGWTGEEGILVDDSQGNIDSCAGKLGYLQIYPRTGFATDTLVWLEARSDQTFNASPTMAAPTMAAPTMAKSDAMSLAPAFIAGLLVYFH